MAEDAQKIKGPIDGLFDISQITFPELDESRGQEEKQVLFDQMVFLNVENRQHFELNTALMEQSIELVNSKIIEQVDLESLHSKIHFTEGQGTLAAKNNNNKNKTYSNTNSPPWRDGCPPEAGVRTYRYDMGGSGIARDISSRGLGKRSPAQDPVRAYITTGGREDDDGSARNSIGYKVEGWYGVEPRFDNCMQFVSKFEKTRPKTKDENIQAWKTANTNIDANYLPVYPLNDDIPNLYKQIGIGDLKLDEIMVAGDKNNYTCRGVRGEGRVNYDRNTILKYYGFQDEESFENPGWLQARSSARSPVRLRQSGDDGTTDEEDDAVRRAPAPEPEYSSGASSHLRSDSMVVSSTLTGPTAAAGGSGRGAASASTSGPQISDEEERKVILERRLAAVRRARPGDEGGPTSAGAGPRAGLRLPAGASTPAGATGGRPAAAGTSRAVATTSVTQGRPRASSPGAGAAGGAEAGGAEAGGAEEAIQLKAEIVRGFRRFKTATSSLARMLLRQKSFLRTVGGPGVADVNVPARRIADQAEVVRLVREFEDAAAGVRAEIIRSIHHNDPKIKAWFEKMQVFMNGLDAAAAPVFASARSTGEAEAVADIEAGNEPASGSLAVKTILAACLVASEASKKFENFFNGELDKIENTE